MAKLADIYRENRMVVLRLILFSLLMVLVPLAVFAAIYFGAPLDSPNVLAKSGIGAVVALNVVVIAFVIMAWREDPKND